METFKDKVFQRAREIAHGVESPEWESDISSMVKQEVALLLGQIGQLENHYSAQKELFLDAECRIDSELMQLGNRLPKYSPVIFPERERLMERLQRIDSEKSRFSDSILGRFISLESQLFSLIRKHDSVSLPENGYRQNTKETKTSDA